MKKLLLILLSFALIYSCSPVRTRDYNKSKRASENSQTERTSSSEDDGDNAGEKTDRPKTGKPELKTEKPIFKRFSDTTFIYIGEYKQAKPEPAPKKQTNHELAKAIELFDKGETTQACEQISSLLSSMNKDSEDYVETLFYASECFIAKNSFDPARKILIELLSRDDLNIDIKEKALVRLGQVFCIDGDVVSAERLFKQLKREYPKSIYLQIADCDIIDKK